MALGILRGRAALVAGMTVGAGLALVGILRVPPPPVPDGSADAVALVNDRPITRSQFERALAALERDRRNPVTADARRAVLDRLVDEELLVQRGLALGMPRSDRKLRADLVTAVVDVATFDAETIEPEPQELTRFFEEHRDSLGAAASVRIAEVFVATGRGDGDDRVEGMPRGEEEALARAVAAADRLRAGESIDEVARELGDEPAVALPDALVPLAKLRDFLGPTAALRASTLAVGEISEPVRSADGYHVLSMLERGRSEAGPRSTRDAEEQEAGKGDLEGLRDETLREYRRRAGEAALRAYLEGLRRAATLTVLVDPTTIQASEATREAAVAGPK